MSEKLLGVLGGMGPLATVYFAKLIVNMTDATVDQDHIPMMIYNHTSIPDRTQYILDNNNPNPVPILQNDAKLLEKTGVSLIAIPCNTAHNFYEEIQKSVNIPVLHIVKETVEYIAKRDNKCKKVGILATKGTIKSGVYQDFCKKNGLSAVLPPKVIEDRLMDVIYNQVKTGRAIDSMAFLNIVEAMKNYGCDVVVLGCTELSVIKNDLHIKEYDIVDSLEILSKRCIELCDKKVVDGIF